MYNTNRWSAEYITSMHGFLEVAKTKKNASGFMCCPCSDCRNERDYHDPGTLHLHLLKYGFMSNYVVWTKHGERGVVMEDDEEEEEDIPDWAASQAFADTLMEDADEEELPAHADGPADMARFYRMHKGTVKTKKKRQSSNV